MASSRFLLPVAALLAALLGCAGPAASRPAGGPLRLIAAGGEATSLEALRAGHDATVLVFWSAGCPCVRRYQARVDALLEAWPASRVRRARRLQQRRRAVRRGAGRGPRARRPPPALPRRGRRRGRGARRPLHAHRGGPRRPRPGALPRLARQRAAARRPRAGSPGWSRPWPGCWPAATTSPPARRSTAAPSPAPSSARRPGPAAAPTEDPNPRRRPPCASPPCCPPSP